MEVSERVKPLHLPPLPPKSNVASADVFADFETSDFHISQLIIAALYKTSFFTRLGLHQDHHYIIIIMIIFLLFA